MNRLRLGGSVSQSTGFRSITLWNHFVAGAPLHTPQASPSNKSRSRYAFLLANCYCHTVACGRQSHPRSSYRAEHFNPSENMRHALMYVGGFERNFQNLTPETNSFEGSDGKLHPYPAWPASAD